MRISLVINTFNRMHTLPNTLKALEFLRYPDLEVIVVDGPSTDGTMSYLQTNWSDKVKILTCDEANLSKSRNIGIRHASGDIVCFTDDDGIPEPDWLDKLAPAYNNPKVAAAGGWVRNHTGVDYQTKFIVSTRNSTSEVLVENVESLPKPAPHADKFLSLIGVNSSFRRTPLVEVGGFDEEYAYFLDETDVIARLVDAGYEVKIIPDAEVHHKYAPSHIRSQNGTARSWLQIIKSTAYYIIKNAAPSTRLSSSIETVESHKKTLTIHTDWYLSQKMIDEVRHAELLAEIEEGAHKGIFDAFSYPQRRLIGPHQQSQWKNFPRPLPQEKRLRIAFVTPLYPPKPCGGVAVFINNLAKQLASFGHEITVITQSNIEHGHTVDFEDGVWVHRLPNDNSIQLPPPALMPDMPQEPKNMAVRVLSELDRVNEKRKFQLIVGSIWDLDIAAVIASQKYKTAMYLVTSYKLMEESKSEWKEDTDFYENHVAKMIRAEMWALNHVNRLLASTQAILRDIETAYGIKTPTTKLDILPFGVPEPLYLPPKKHKYKDELTLLFVGRFEHRKGADLILKILPEIMQKYPSVRFIGIGDNTIPTEDGKPYTVAFMEKYNSATWIDRVAFLGHVDDATLEDAYMECDIFVAPSRYESFGLIYLEAMRFAKPCIGTTAGGIPEVVCDEKTGLLAVPGDDIALKQAIERLLDNKKFRQGLGEAGRQRYLEKFTANQFASSFETLARQWI